MASGGRARLKLSRNQIVAFRRGANGLDERLPYGPTSLRRAAWAGLQDSMPRAAVLSIDARVTGGQPTSWQDPTLVQLWGPRFSVFVVAAADLAIFSLGTLPDDPESRRRASGLADALEAAIGSEPTPRKVAGVRLGLRHPNALRYAGATGRVLIRWEGSRDPTVWTVPAPTMDPAMARLELTRRYLHVYGPTTAPAFGRWAGLGPSEAAAAFEALAGSLTPVTTPIGEAWILAGDEDVARSASSEPAPVRLLPSGDAFFLLQGSDRELLVPDADRRASLWTSRVWPGALILAGEPAGTWRRANHVFTLSPWRKLSETERDAVVTEAASLPLGLTRPVVIRWED